MQMDKEQYGKAKACLVSCMQEGYSWQVAKAVAGLQISQSSAYRLWRAFRQCGEVALSDRRHGHPILAHEGVRIVALLHCKKTLRVKETTPCFPQSHFLH
jgi:helix-turn-helix protein